MNTAAEPGPVAANRLAAEEDRLLACVHCGFCLTACPTYTRLGDEGDSPRGRIVLMRAVAEGRLEADSEAFGIHIDQCLGCRACEPVCPSGVQYGFLVERARASAVDASGQRLSTRLLLAVFGSRWLSALAGLGGRLLRAGGFAGMLARATPKSLGAMRMGLAMLAATRPATRPATHTRGSGNRSKNASQQTGIRTGHATRADAREFAEPHALRGGYPEGTSLPPQAESPEIRPRVAMLRGCVQHALYRHVNDATRLVLEDAGCETVSVHNQQCCGALHAHSGALDHALDLARTNIDAFLAADPDIIVVNAAGCGAMLKEYREQLAHDPDYAERAEILSEKVRDISEYLVEIGYQSSGDVSSNETVLRVTYDAPCHLMHAQRITHAPTALVAAVPGVELVPLDRADECCGGAGIYGITHPDIGGRILADKVAAVVATKADVVLTPNPGCMMQIGAGLMLAGHDIPAVHPIEILARSVSAQKEQ